MAVARFFILVIGLILMSSIVLAVPLVDVTEISDPLLLCGKPELHLDNLTVDERSQWKDSYYKFMKAVTYSNHGKRILIKNPANKVKVDRRNIDIREEDKSFTPLTIKNNNGKIIRKLNSQKEFEKYLTLR